MLDNFKNQYAIAYRILNQDLKKNRCSHAYLFETNGNKDKEKFVMSFVKALLCPFRYTNANNCTNCFQCQNIDNGNFLELKIIYPDGMWIKKEQLLALQDEFKMKGIENNKKVYIIYQAEKMNASAANSILKFLEEPQEGIVAILVTDNIHQLLNTIVSRCQIITLNNYESKKTLQSVISKTYDTNEQLDEIKNVVIDFAQFVEKNGYDSLLYTKKILFDKITEKEDFTTFFEILVFYYKDMINLKLNRNSDFFDETDFLNKTDKTIEQISEKINIILTSKENLKINANLNLLIDNLIIDVGDI